ncbi:MAG TPA: hypothetical protein VJ873_13000, partial [bacterium]|nr:hypothetical protein [bacterium]
PVSVVSTDNVAVSIQQFSINSSDPTKLVTANSTVLSPNTLTASITLTGLPDGPLAIGFRAIDEVGNQEALQSQTVVLDNTPPVTRITTPNTVDVNSVGQVSLAADDPSTSSGQAGSGVSFIRVQVTSQQGVQAPQTFFSNTVPAGAIVNGYIGANELVFQAVDNLGNVEPAHTVVIQTVPTYRPPQMLAVTNLLFGAPQAATDHGFFIGTNTPVTLSAPATVDLPEGTYYLTGTTFSIIRDLGNSTAISNMAYTGPFTLDGLGLGRDNYRIVYSSSYANVNQYVGNDPPSLANNTAIEFPNTFSFTAEDEAPRESAVLTPYIYTDSQGQFHTNPGATVAIPVLDAPVFTYVGNSGVSETTYNLNNLTLGTQVTALYQGTPFTVADAPGKVVLSYESADNLDHIAHNGNGFPLEIPTGRLPDNQQPLTIVVDLNPLKYPLVLEAPSLTNVAN